jgi:hypothetical protein
MSKQVQVSLYIARVHERGKKQPLQLDKLHGSGDFIKIVHEALRSRHNQFVQLSSGRRRLQITGDLRRQGRIVDGVLEVGESGHTSVMKDEKSGQELFHRKVSHVEMIPLYFRGWSPSGGTFAAFAFQHYGDYGCKTAVHDVIQQELKVRMPDLVLTMREAVPGEVVEAFFKKGLVKQLRFTRFGVPSDRADSYAKLLNNPDEANLELRVVAKRGDGLSLSSLARNVFGRQEISSKNLYELDGVAFNRFKMKVSLQGKDKWLTVGQFMTMHSRLDVSKDVELDRTGHPKRASIEEVCQGLLEKVALEAKG